jgi:hypothetical protein
MNKFINQESKVDKFIFSLSIVLVHGTVSVVCRLHTVQS